MPLQEAVALGQIQCPGADVDWVDIALVTTLISVPLIPHHAYYQLVIPVLLWLCIMLPHLWPSPPDGATQLPSQPIMPKRKRSSEPKAFESGREQSIRKIQVFSHLLRSSSK
jgi:hypothetical protein